MVYETSLFSKDDKIVQKTTIKNCTVSVEVLNEVLKKFPFNASVVRSSCDGKDKETVIYVYLNHEVSFRTITGLAGIIQEAVAYCQRINETLKTFEDTVKALIKDCKLFENETTEPNSSTAKKEYYLRQSR